MKTHGQKQVSYQWKAVSCASLRLFHLPPWSQAIQLPTTPRPTRRSQAPPLGRLRVGPSPVPPEVRATARGSGLFLGPGNDRQPR